jgi:hypothetical protein
MLWATRIAQTQQKTGSTVSSGRAAAIATTKKIQRTLGCRKQILGHYFSKTVKTPNTTLEEFEELLRERPRKAAKRGKKVAENARNPFGMSPCQMTPEATKKVKPKA